MTMKQAGGLHPILRRRSRLAYSILSHLPDNPIKVPDNEKQADGSSYFLAEDNGRMIARRGAGDRMRTTPSPVSAAHPRRSAARQQSALARRQSSMAREWSRVPRCPRCVARQQSGMAREWSSVPRCPRCVARQQSGMARELNSVSRGSRCTARRQRRLACVSTSSAYRRGGKTISRRRRRSLHNGLKLISGP